MVDGLNMVGLIVGLASCPVIYCNEVLLMFDSRATLGHVSGSCTASPLNSMLKRITSFNAITRLGMMRSG